MRTLYLLFFALACSFTMYAQDAPILKKASVVEKSDELLIKEQNKTPFSKENTQSKESGRFIIPSQEKPPKISKSEFATLPKEKQDFILKNPDKYSLE